MITGYHFAPSLQLWGERVKSVSYTHLDVYKRQGLVFTQRTNGRFITEDTQLIDEVKKQMATERITQLLKEMEQMGYSVEEVIALIKSTGKGE